MTGRLLCWLGWHRWYSLDQFLRGDVVTRCSRCGRYGCPR